MKYRKKPVVIEAFQYDGDFMYNDGDFMYNDGTYYVPQWAVEALQSGEMYYDSNLQDEEPCELYIKTLEGNMKVSVGDYIIRGVNGEVYPCKPDIFVKTYEEVTE